MPAQKRRARPASSCPRHRSRLPPRRPSRCVVAGLPRLLVRSLLGTPPRTPWLRRARQAPRSGRTPCGRSDRTDPRGTLLSQTRFRRGLIRAGYPAAGGRNSGADVSAPRSSGVCAGTDSWAGRSAVASLLRRVPRNESGGPPGTPLRPLLRNRRHFRTPLRCPAAGRGSTAPPVPVSAATPARRRPPLEPAPIAGRFPAPHPPRDPIVFSPPGRMPPAPGHAASSRLRPALGPVLQPGPSGC